MAYGYKDLNKNSFLLKIEPMEKKCLFMPEENHILQDQSISIHFNADSQNI